LWQLHAVVIHNSSPDARTRHLDKIIFVPQNAHRIRDMKKESGIGKLDEDLLHSDNGCYVYFFHRWGAIDLT
jgi:hypothetical protein